MFDALANIKISEVLDKKPVGEPVNPHVVKAAPAPSIDTERMRSLVHGDIPNNAPIPEVEPTEID